MKIVLWLLEKIKSGHPAVGLLTVRRTLRNGSYNLLGSVVGKN